MAADNISIEFCFHETINTYGETLLRGVIDPKTDVSWNCRYKNGYANGKQGEQEKKGGQY